ncbi:MAG: D-ribose ABC transporter substrate-binding protein [Ruminococcus sp.]|nr:D-ribose ABC transporter substrate-binding protein [Ruminococcus sp.]
MCMKKILALLISVMTLLCFAGCDLITIDGEYKGDPADYKGNGSIGLSVSTQNNPFFVTLVDGAKKAAKEKNVKLIVVDAGDDAAKQVSDIEDLIAKNISVLIVNPVDSDTVSSVVQSAVNRGIKVISADRVVNGVDIDCQIASDNVLGAELATQFIVDKVGEGAKVAELQGTSGASAAIDRGKGFHNIADDKLKVAASQPADFDRTKGMTVMENILQANGDIKAVFAANDEMALGAMEAISASRKNIVVVGFDATDDAIDSIKEGRMSATIAQQPDLIGATSVETAIRLINGETVEKSIPVEVTLITAENAG